MRWVFSNEPPEEAVRALEEGAGVPAMVARLMVQRGVADAGRASIFLEPRLRSLEDPFLLPGMGRAVEALLEARSRGERVVVFGDYDVDGVTASAILLEVMECFGWTVAGFLPRRLEEGYGLNEASARRCLAEFPSRWLLAVDCGTTAVETIAQLKREGVQTLVLDHHQPGAELPAAAALVNPQLGEHGRDLCSAGLAFKLAHALVKRGRELGWAGAAEYDLRPLLDLVALGTIADMVPLLGENRVLVSAGLERLARTKRPGLLALMEVSGMKEGEVNAGQVAFHLAPRLNAAGRLEHASAALDLLRAASMEQARPLAAVLDAQNQERRALEQQIATECLTGARARFDPARDFAIVEANPGWHVGVVGIVAARLQREFHRPVIVLGGDGATLRGSGRSIEGFDIAAGLAQCADLLERHGGHAMAAGLSLRPELVDALRARLNELVRAALPAEAYQPVLRLDAEVPLAELTVGCLETLERLAPFGCGNPEIHVAIRKVRLRGEVRRMGAEQKHARFTVTDGRGTQEVVWWNAGEVPPGEFDLAASPQLNRYNGTTRVQLRLLGVQS